MVKNTKKFSKADISGIEITPFSKTPSSLRAFVSFLLYGRFFVGNVAIHTDLKNKSLRLVYPVKVLGNDKTLPIFHPIDREAGEILTKKIIKEYASLFGEGQ